MSNRLINEKSPYLLQHAHNPVDWYPWSDAAFARAKAENRPVFLSIGYATCHWCHVMEKESFEDEETARYLNETFICIKVDREERPDIDAVYMNLCQMLIGSGGWPLTIFMTPNKKPFFASTYLPKRNRFGRTGLIELCKKIKETWRSERQKVMEAAETISTKLADTFIFSPAEQTDASLLDQAYNEIRPTFDSRFGGFSPAPKFPMPHRLLFLMRYYHQSGNEKALEMVKKTLITMRLGGIWDHVGFGFHRYATDKKWLLPHFEKMLYDQALISMAYLEIFQITRDSFFSQTAKEIFTYVIGEMTSEQGAFFAAQDADSEGEEGKFFTWTTEKFRQVLGEEEAKFWKKIFNLSPDGNFFEEATGQKTGTNILHLTKPLVQWANELEIEEKQFLLKWKTARKKLYQQRQHRIHPFKDDKILTDWNGLMIASLALASRVLDIPAYIKVAEKTANFILTKMQDDSGGLWHRFRDNEAAVKPHANDYAFFIWGLLHLYQAAFNPTYLHHAIRLQNRMLDDYWDTENGGFFLSAKTDTELPIRPKELYDGATPSANSVSLFNLMCLSRLSGEVKWENKAKDLVRSFAGTVKIYPAAYTHFLSSLYFALGREGEVVITGKEDAADTREMLSSLNGRFAPNQVVLFKSDKNKNELAEVAEFTVNLQPVKGKATAYVCADLSCSQPTNDVRKMLELIRSNEKIP
ncbi:MAG: thioredoxin domain-containing protein [Desulfobacterales bacterium]|nr:thioredoxin domain-containing protein [Desulfobacterales bacterium]